MSIDAITLFGCDVEYDFVVYGDGDVEGFEFVEQDGGGEGGSEYCHTVVKRKEDGKHFMLEYSYYSYHGFEIDFDGWFEVAPTEVVVTQFARV